MNKANMKIGLGDGTTMPGGEPNAGRPIWITIRNNSGTNITLNQFWKKYGETPRLSSGHRQIIINRSETVVYAQARGLVGPKGGFGLYAQTSEGGGQNLVLSCKYNHPFGRKLTTVEFTDEIHYGFISANIINPDDLQHEKARCTVILTRNYNIMSMNTEPRLSGYAVPTYNFDSHQMKLIDDSHRPMIMRITNFSGESLEFIQESIFSGSRVILGSYAQDGPVIHIATIHDQSSGVFYVGSLRSKGPQGSFTAVKSNDLSSQNTNGGGILEAPPYLTINYIHPFSHRDTKVFFSNNAESVSASISVDDLNHHEAKCTILIQAPSTIISDTIPSVLELNTPFLGIRAIANKNLSSVSGVFVDSNGNTISGGTLFASAISLRYIEMSGRTPNRTGNVFILLSLTDTNNINGIWKKEITLENPPAISSDTISSILESNASFSGTATASKSLSSVSGNFVDSNGNAISGGSVNTTINPSTLTMINVSGTTPNQTGSIIIALSFTDTSNISGTGTIDVTLENPPAISSDTIPSVLELNTSFSGYTITADRSLGSIVSVNFTDSDGNTIGGSITATINPSTPTMINVSGTTPNQTGAIFITLSFTDTSSINGSGRISVTLEPPPVISSDTISSILESNASFSGTATASKSLSSVSGSFVDSNGNAISGGSVNTTINPSTPTMINVSGTTPNQTGSIIIALSFTDTSSINGSGRISVTLELPPVISSDTISSILESNVSFSGTATASKSLSSVSGSFVDSNGNTISGGSVNTTINPSTPTMINVSGTTPNQTGAIFIALSFTDTSSINGSGRISVTLEPPPVISSDTIPSVLESNASFSGTATASKSLSSVSGSFVDSNGNAISGGSVTTTINSSTLTMINVSGTTPDQTGAIFIALSFTDTSSISGTGTIDVTLENPPVISSDTIPSVLGSNTSFSGYTITADKSLGSIVSVNFTDSDGNTIGGSITAIINSSTPTMINVSGTTPNQTGSIIIALSFTDTSSINGSGRISVTLEPPPVISSDTISSILESNASFSGTATASKSLSSVSGSFVDSNGNTISGGSVNTTINPSTPTMINVSGTTPNQTGAIFIALSFTDTSSINGSGRISVTLEPPPVISSDTIPSVLESNASFSGTATASKSLSSVSGSFVDSNGNAISGGSVTTTINSSTLTMINVSGTTPDQTGAIFIALSFTDTSSISGTGTIDVTLENPPVISSHSITLQSANSSIPEGNTVTANENLSSASLRFVRPPGTINAGGTITTTVSGRTITLSGTTPTTAGLVGIVGTITDENNISGNIPFGLNGLGIYNLQ